MMKLIMTFSISFFVLNSEISNLEVNKIGNVINFDNTTKPWINPWLVGVLATSGIILLVICPLGLCYKKGLVKGMDYIV
jgi:hypothetical protein